MLILYHALVKECECYTHVEQTNINIHNVRIVGIQIELTGDKNKNLCNTALSNESSEILNLWRSY